MWQCWPRAELERVLVLLGEDKLLLKSLKADYRLTYRKTTVGKERIRRLWRHQVQINSQRQTTDPDREKFPSPRVANTSLENTQTEDAHLTGWLQNLYYATCIDSGHNCRQGNVHNVILRFYKCHSGLNFRQRRKHKYISSIVQSVYGDYGICVKSREWRKLIIK